MTLHTFHLTSHPPPVCLVSVVAEALAGVEDEASGACLGVSRAVRAVNELITDRLVWVGEVAISSGTAGAGLWRLELFSPC